MNENPARPDPSPRRHPRGLAIALMLIGLGSAASYALHLADAPLWVPGVALLGLGADRRATRPIIAGGVLSGAGLAITLQSSPWLAALGDPARSGLFLVCFALGWFLIPVVTALATARCVWWPVVPGLVMAISGGALWLLDGRIAGALALGWPVLFVSIGLFLLMHWNRKN